MRRYLLAVLLLALGLLSSCASPKLLRPVALDNAKNISAYVQNNKRVHNTLLQMMRSQAASLRIYRLSKVARICDELAAGVASADRADVAIQKVRQAITGEIEKMKGIRTSGSAHEVASVHPVVGDVAKGLLDIDEAARMCWEVKKVIDLRPASAYVILGDLLRKVDVIKRFGEGEEAVQKAYLSYVGEMDGQANLAIRHANEIVEFTETKTDILEVFLGVSRDQGVREKILALMPDEESKKRTSAVLEAIDTAVGQAEEAVPVSGK